MEIASLAVSPYILTGLYFSKNTAIIFMGYRKSKDAGEMLNQPGRVGYSFPMLTRKSISGTAMTLWRMVFPGKTSTVNITSGKAVIVMLE
jgi:hypothetical protein